MNKMNIMYHLSDPKNRESILKNGLLTDFDLTGFSAIFLSDTLSDELPRPKGRGFEFYKLNSKG